MKTNEILKLLNDKDFLDKIYHFSYRRCTTSFEAEDLCSDIMLAVITAVQKQESIDNFYAFVWTIARRVYADYSEKRNAERQVMSIETNDLPLVSKENEIDKYIEEAVEQEHINKIFTEIAFLSNAYREVMILYYIDELKVRDIAARLNISETTVKQRLFSARNSIRKEVETMNERTLSLKPIHLQVIGTGDPWGNDPGVKVERMFSQNLIYLCKGEPKSARKLSEELCVPMPYIEEELEIQCRGANGKYGMLRRLDNGKYIVNIHLVDCAECVEANGIYTKHLPAFCRELKNALKKNEEKILSFPFLSEQKDLRFIMWSLLSRIVWELQGRVSKVIAEKYFSDITPIKRDFSCVAIAYRDDQELAFEFYGCDEINANSVGGYKSVSVSNIYGKRIKEHFHCGHNLSQDQKLLMVLRSIGGLSIDELTENEKEIVAKAIECGYLRKKGGMIEPKMIVIDRQNAKEFYHFVDDFNNDMEDIIDPIAHELAEFMRSHIPEYLLNEYHIYNKLLVGNGMISEAADEFIKEGLLSEPENRLCAEGMLMIVDK